MAKRRLHPRETAALAWQANTDGDHDGTFRIAPNLYLQMRGLSRSWLMRWEAQGKANWMGLGAYEDVPQERAEELVAKYRAVVRAGGDARLARDEDRVAAGEPVRHSPSAKRAMTFRDAARAYMAEFDATWSEAHAAQWRQTLRDYAWPLIGDLPLRQVGVDEVVQVMEPLWRSKHTTAVKMRTRIRLILDWAEAMGWRTGDNPANSKAVDIRLGAASHAVRHREAIPYQQMPSLYQALVEVGKVRADVTRFMILTAVRASEAIGARWEEMNLEQRVWTIPAARMKATRDHRVPLSTQAMELLERRAGSGLVFPSDRGGPMHRSVPKALIQRLRGTRETAHGCRSSFVEWCDEEAHVDMLVRELCLAHKVGDATVAAYARSDLLARRARVMQDWADFLAG